MLRTLLAHELLLKNGFYFNHGLVEGYVDMSTGSAGGQKRGSYLL